MGRSKPSSIYDILLDCGRVSQSESRSRVQRAEEVGRRSWDFDVAREENGGGCEQHSFSLADVDASLS